MGALALKTGKDKAQQHEEAALDLSQYLTFQLCGETFAIGILAIKELLEYMPMTQVPMMPSFVRGVMNLRGAVVPVIDLSLRFGKGETAVQRRTCVVIVEVEHEEQQQYIGVLVDAVHEVLAIPDSDIVAAPQFGNHIRSDFIAGMAKVQNKFVVLLDLSRALSVEEMAQLAMIDDDAVAMLDEHAEDAQE
ncbi:purine-binding chemotaxis protein CheW [Chitinibacter bivalviorum]|uniref:Purine-binding chemotaxis protein CheW n=1 Tax=Chitinibacter bivalviorum TaxID=2739434 RepID=A0A7H9BLL7_9NEIS|nr:chemotaxis protein CheW [Chitinibacter bivalviorum]QLG89312.1 purine-binding chemotaxis protein CheW [Chitinibacter bivalviorum]